MSFLPDVLDICYSSQIVCQIRLAPLIFGKNAEKHSSNCLSKHLVVFVTSEKSAYNT
jgi:hypothetical protein